MRYSTSDSFVLETVTRLVFFVLNIFALYLFLRGHNEPGGGFIAGLVTGLSFLLLSLGIGLDETNRVMRVDPARVAFLGLAIAVASACIPLFLGQTFFQHSHPYFKDVPVLGDVYLGTPLFFDLGVYLIVAGSTVKTVFAMAYSTGRRHAFVREEEARYASILDTPIEDSPSHARGEFTTTNVPPNQEGF